MKNTRKILTKLRIYLEDSNLTTTTSASSTTNINDDVSLVETTFCPSVVSTEAVTRKRQRSPSPPSPSQTSLSTGTVGESPLLMDPPKPPQVASLKLRKLGRDSWLVKGIVHFLSFFIIFVLIAG